MALTRINNNSLSAVTSAGLPAGSVSNIVSVPFTDAFTTGSSTLTDVTGLSASITPVSTSSKILVMVTMNYSHSNYSYGGFPNVHFALTDGNNTPLIQGNSSGARKRSVFGGILFYAAGQMNNASMNYLWSPATTSQVTAKIRCATNSGTISVNESFNADNQGGYGNLSGPSTITLIEIAGS